MFIIQNGRALKNNCDKSSGISQKMASSCLQYMLLAILKDCLKKNITTDKTELYSNFITNTILSFKCA